MAEGVVRWDGAGSSIIAQKNLRDECVVARAARGFECGSTIRTDVQRIGDRLVSRGLFWDMRERPVIVREEGEKRNVKVIEKMVWRRRRVDFSYHYSVDG